MSEENQARHKHLLQKHAKELGGLKVSPFYSFVRLRCNFHLPLYCRIIALLIHKIGSTKPAASLA